MEKTRPYYGESGSTNFPGSPHTMGFVAFSCTTGNWWGNPCISHLMKYTIGWGSYGEKSPILWEKYKYQFPRFIPYERFCCIFSYYQKLMGKPMHFPHNEVYHRMGNWMGKKHPSYGKSMSIIFPDFPHTMGFIAFFRTMGNLWGNPCISHMMILVNFFLWLPASYRAWQYFKNDVYISGPIFVKLSNDFDTSCLSPTFVKKNIFLMEHMKLKRSSIKLV